MSFKDFIHKYKFKKATSNVRTQHIHSRMSLCDVGIFLRDWPLSSDRRINNLHQSKGTHWVAFFNQNYFDSSGWFPPKRLSRNIIKQNWHCIISENKMQGLTSEKDSFCATFCLYKLYLTKIEKRDFKSAVLNLYYQRFPLRKWPYEK